MRSPCHPNRATPHTTPNRARTSLTRGWVSQSSPVPDADISFNPRALDRNRPPVGPTTYQSDGIGCPSSGFKA